MQNISEEYAQEISIILSHLDEAENLLTSLALSQLKRMVFDDSERENQELKAFEKNLQKAKRSVLKAQQVLHQQEMFS